MLPSTLCSAVRPFFSLTFPAYSNSASYLSFAFETISFCASIFFFYRNALLAILLSFLLYLHKVFIDCCRLYPDICRCHMKCFQDFFLRSRNRIIHTVSTVTLADQLYLFSSRIAAGTVM